MVSPIPSPARSPAPAELAQDLRAEVCGAYNPNVEMGDALFAWRTRTMAKEVLRRTAADNKYLHKDFHGALSLGIEYLHERWGDEAVRQYLRQFASAYYAPLTQAIKQRGLEPLRSHIQRIYDLEGGDVVIRGDQDELIVEVKTCPAVMHMRERGFPVARLFCETIKTVNETICEGTDFAAELVQYDPDTGSSVQRFYRRR